VALQQIVKTLTQDNKCRHQHAVQLVDEVLLPLAREANLLRLDPTTASLSYLSQSPTYSQASTADTMQYSGSSSSISTMVDPNGVD